MHDNEIAKGQISRIFNLVNDRNSVTGYEAHQLKQWMSESLDFSATGVSGKANKVVDKAAKELRYSLNDVLKSKSENYGRINEKWSNNIEARNQFNNAFGNFEDTSSSRYLTHLGDRTMAATPEANAALDNITKTARQYSRNGNVIGGDIDAQRIFLSQMRFAHPTQAASRFSEATQAAELMRGGAQTLEGVALSSLGNVYYGGMKAADGLKRMIFSSDADEQVALNTMMRFLRN